MSSNKSEKAPKEKAKHQRESLSNESESAGYTDTPAVFALLQPDCAKEIEEERLRSILAEIDYHFDDGRERYEE